jgi:hypothetical protein
LPFLFFSSRYFSFIVGINSSSTLEASSLDSDSKYDSSDDSCSLESELAADRFSPSAPFFSGLLMLPIYSNIVKLVIR